MKKEIKTNVMRILDKEHIPYETHFYPHGKEAVDGVTVAELTGQNPDYVFKTLVTVSNTKEYFVFVIPVARELDLKKAAKAVGVSRVTAWRYLERLADDGVVERHTEYGRAGRPQIRYTWR